MPIHTDCAEYPQIAAVCPNKDCHTPRRCPRAIAEDVARHWKNVAPAAVPYLEAMHELEDLHQGYYYDSARSVLAYFLSNAKTWKGPVARHIKREIKLLLVIGERK